MRQSWLLFGCATIVAPTAANAADQLKFGAAPAWVRPQVIPQPSAKGTDRPVALLLHDQQVLLEPRAIVSYAELAFKIQKPEGLAAGNLSVAWDPATDTVTVNRLEIRRGGQIIDVIKSGQTFTTMRRESNLEVASLDGQLTANIQPEGLQEGDIVVLATTTEHIDPVLKGHVEAAFAPWAEAQIGLAHARLLWPSNVPLKLQKSGDLPAPQQQTREGLNVYELTMRDTDPVIAPKGAPVRFNIGRLGEATDFRTWADPAKLFMPLYADASVVPPSGPLREEVEKIRKASTDSKVRAEQALQLVQGRIRYVALLMGQGGYVPAAAATTWSRRFGDCKAKTALLLAILHELGISAEPVLVNSRLGDAVAQRLPMAGIFNHVLVRAHVNGKDYWLDGTRIGDKRLEDIEVPDFGWGLPLVDGAQLVHMVPAPLDRPTTETSIAIDASAGIYAPAQVTADQILRGDLAMGLSSGLSSLTDAQRKEFFDAYWKRIIDEVTPTVTSFSFEKESRQLHMSMQGKTKLDWTGNYYHLPNSSIGYEPDLKRPEGPLHNAPFAVSYPDFTRTVTNVRFPPGFFPANIAKLVPAPVRSTLIGVQYSRTQSAAADGMRVETSTRRVVPEVDYKAALAAEAELKALANGDVSVRLPRTYRATAADLASLKSDTPGSAAAFVARGNTLMDSRQYDAAIADFTRALELDPKNVTTLADRGIAYVSTNKSDLADKDLDAAAAIEPENEIVHRARGLKAELAGDCASAVQAYSRSLQSEPGNSFALGHRAMCENVLGRHSEAVSDAMLALERDPAWEQLRAVRLDSLARLGQKDAAAREAERIVTENPQTAAGAWIYIARIYARVGLQPEAVAAVDKAIAIKPEPSTYVVRAEIRSPTDLKGRMADIDAALKLEPLDFEAIEAKASLMAEQGDLKGALASYDRVLKSVPAQSPLSLARGILLYKLGRVAEGERVLAAWRRGAYTATELNQLCWKKATAGIALQSALKDCSDALQINPHFVPVIDSLAFVNLRLGRLREAVNLYDRVLSKAQVAASYMGRALAYRALGDSMKAAADRSEALRQDALIESRFAGYGLTFEASAPLARAH